MAECIPEDDLLDLAQARRPLGDAPALEAHLADCPACSALLSTLLSASRDDEPVRDLAGRSLGPYRLDGLIGAGAMGEVYRAFDERLHRHVAVKALSARFAESPERVRRLEAEARAAAAISHPNVVTVYDTGSDAGVPFLVSELITGETLRSRIDRGSIPRREALELALGLARGLAAAHGQGVVHRDLKPGNLIVTEDGTLKILDFGLARMTSDRDADETEPGTLLGTSGYLSPEQARGEPADARSDVFAVGAILHEMLSGRRAFGGATFAERLSAVLRDSPEPLSDPAALIIQRCLEKDPRKRFQSASDLAWVIEAQLRGDPPPLLPAPLPPAPRPAPSVSRRTFLAGAALAGVGGALLSRALWPARRAFRPEFRQHTFRQGRVAAARFTKNGDSLLYSAAFDGQPVALHLARLGGGGTRALPLPSAQILAVSSRGELALALDHRFLDGFHHEGQLALAPLEGGEPRRLDLDAQHADFTPDGSALAVVRRVSGRYRLELPVGNPLLEGGWLAHPRISPDGTLVACLVYQDPRDDGGDVVLVPAKGGAPRRIGRTWNTIDGLAWAPNGRALWVSASTEGGNSSVRALALDGTELTELSSAGRLRVFDIAQDGLLAVAHSSGRLRMMGRAPGGERDVDLAQGDVCMVTDISADGNTIVFGEFGDVDTASGGYLRPTSGGRPVRLGVGFPHDLADDGRGVISLRRGDPWQIVVYPVPAGQERQIPVPGLVDVRAPRWCAGGRIVLGGAEPGRRPRLWRLDADDQRSPLTEEGLHGFCLPSPDGQTVALLANDRLFAIPIDGKPPLVVPGHFPDDHLAGWFAATGEVILRSLSPPLRIRRVGLETGAQTSMFEIDPPHLGRRGVYTAVVSASGDAYAYSFSQELSRLYTMTTEDPT